MPNVEVCFFCEDETSDCTMRSVILWEDCGEHEVGDRPVCRRCRSLAEDCAADAEGY